MQLPLKTDVDEKLAGVAKLCKMGSTLSSIIRFFFQTLRTKVLISCLIKAELAY